MARLSPLRPSWTRPQISAKVSTTPAAGGASLASAPPCFRRLVSGPARRLSRVQSWKSGRYLDSLVTRELQLKMLFGGPKARSLHRAPLSPVPLDRMVGMGTWDHFYLAEHCACLLLVQMGQLRLGVLSNSRWRGKEGKKKGRLRKWMK